ncbi:MAG TPA: hypothetical protein VMG30_14990 [Acidobacteriota bacterium]|nr:hypothetical protein [Acidobacteriota bacterium]
MISTEQSPSISSKQIDHLQKRFDAWRKSHKPRTRIPDRLWDSAVRIAGQYGLHRTAKVLHLDYYALKKRLDAAGIKQGAAPSFIELSPPALERIPEYVIELETRNGSKMRIQIRGVGAPDLNALSSTFWRGKH